MADESMFSLDLNDLIVVEEVQVVKQLDLSALQSTLKWIVGQIPQNVPVPVDPEEFAALRATVSQLAKDNTDLRSELQALQNEQQATKEQLVSLQSVEPPSLVIPEALLQLPETVVALESKIQELSALASVPQQADDGETKPSSPPRSPARPGVDSSVFDKVISDLRDKLVGLDAVIKETQTSGEDVRRALIAKADYADIEGLRKALAEKANQAELDSLLLAGKLNVSGAEPVAVMEVKADGTLDPVAVTEALNQLNNEVATLKGMSVVTQERLKAKADQSAVEDSVRLVSTVAKDLDSLQQEAVPNLHRLSSRVDAAEAMIADLTKMPGIMIEALGQDVEKLAAQLALLKNAPVPSSTAAAASPDRSRSIKQSAAAQDAAAPRSPAAATAAAAAASGAPAAELGAMEVVGRGTPTGFMTQTSMAIPASPPRVGTPASAMDSTLDVLRDTMEDLKRLLASKLDDAALAPLREQILLLSQSKADKEDVAADKVKNALLASGNMGDEERANAMLSTIQDLLSDKANRAEVEDVRAQLDGRPSIQEFAALKEELSTKANTNDLRSLQQSVSMKPGRDELGTLAEQLTILASRLSSSPYIPLTPQGAPATPQAATPTPPPETPGKGDGPSADLLQAMQSLAELHKDVQALKEGLDIVSHASNIMSLGIEMIGNGANGQNGAMDDGLPKENRSPKGAYERLLGFLRGGDVHFKMDAFDSELLPKMAQKLAGLEAMVRSSAFSRPMNGADIGVKDLEKKVGKLLFDMKQLKDKVGEMGVLGSRVDIGEHAILAGKAIVGYRCMACDRPLERLDEKPGPYVPVFSMPVTVSPGPEMPKMDKRETQPSARGPGRKTDKYDPDKRGPQYWYEDGPALAADQLPKEDVGPHLPPGGWRATGGGAKSTSGTVSPLPPIKGPTSGAASPPPRSPQGFDRAALPTV